MDEGEANRKSFLAQAPKNAAGPPFVYGCSHRSSWTQALWLCIGSLVGFTVPPYVHSVSCKAFRQRKCRVSGCSLLGRGEDSMEAPYCSIYRSGFWVWKCGFLASMWHEGS